MLSTSFLPASAASWVDSATLSAPSQSSTTRQLRSATAAFAAAAGVSCDLTAVPDVPTAFVAAVDGGSATTMARSPPRTYTHILNSRRLTVPTAALASAAPRRKRGGGGGGDEDVGGGWGGSWGGNDDGFGGGGDGEQGPFDGDSVGRWFQDALLLWSVFCAWSAWKVVEGITKQKPPTAAFAALSYSHLDCP